MKTSSQKKPQLNRSDIGLYAIYALGLTIILLQLRSILG